MIMHSVNFSFVFVALGQLLWFGVANAEPAYPFISTQAPINIHDITTPPADSAWQLARIAQVPRIQGWGTPYYLSPRVRKLDWTFPRDPSWGQNVLVYVVDSGVRGTHHQFMRTNPGRSIVDAGLACGSPVPATPPATRDDESHGTGVASMIAGLNTGVAKGATIVPIKIADKGNSLGPARDSQNSISGIDCAIQHFTARHNTNPNLKGVINLSWRIHRYYSNPADKTNGLESDSARAIRRAINAGMHVVIAAGNDGKNLCPGEVSVADQADEWVEDVGQVTVTTVTPGDEQGTGNYGSCVHLTAPGGGYGADSEDDNSLSQADVTTSFSAPMVSGVIAVILSSSPNVINPAQMKTMITTAPFTHPGVLPLDGVPVPPRFPNKIFVNGLPNAQSAVAQ